MEKPLEHQKDKNKKTLSIITKQISLGLQNTKPQINYLIENKFIVQFLRENLEMTEKNAEFSCIFISKINTKVLEQNTFWLSETSKIYQILMQHPRIVTYALLKILKPRKSMGV